MNTLGDPFDQLDRQFADRPGTDAIVHYSYRAAAACQRLIARRRGERSCPNLHETPRCGLCEAQI